MHSMDQLLRKFAQKYKRAKVEADKWDSLQAQFLGLFGNAITILERLPMIMEIENYGVLKEVGSMVRDLPAKQVETLESIFIALHKALDDFKRIRDDLERLWCESSQLLKTEKLQRTSNQAQQRFGLGPSLNECIEGLEKLFIMHRDEYQLKVSFVNSLSYQSSPADLGALQSVLAEQPNIPPDEVRFIFEFFYAGYST